MPHVTVCDTNEMPFEEVRRGRVHMIRRKRLPLESGIPGVTMEYSLSVVPDGYFTPRHRHNFDQIRYTLSGIQSTGLGDLAAGECGYFPEGSYYGPQKQAGECECLVLQFQGASGEHLLSNEEMNATYDRLHQGRRQVRERRLQGLQAGRLAEEPEFLRGDLGGARRPRAGVPAAALPRAGHDAEQEFPLLAGPQAPRPRDQAPRHLQRGAHRHRLPAASARRRAWRPASRRTPSCCYCIDGSFTYDGKTCGKRHLPDRCRTARR